MPGPLGAVGAPGPLGAVGALGNEGATLPMTGSFAPHSTQVSADISFSMPHSGHIFPKSTSGGLKHMADILRILFTGGILEEADRNPIRLFEVSYECS